MKNRLLMLKILRIVFVLLVFWLGIDIWKKLPENIPLHFNAALEPDKHGVKEKFLVQFFFLIAALVPIRPEVIELNSDIIPQEEIDKAQEKENNKAVTLSWIHSLFMCGVFAFTLYLIRKNIV